MDALTDANGSALVIYANAGEDPGDRIACAVLAEPAAPVAPQAATPHPTTTATDPVTPPPAELTAQLVNISRIPLGVADIAEEADEVRIGAAGFEPIASTHRVAFTEVGACDPPEFESAGEDVVVLPDLFINAAGAVDYTAPLGTALSEVTDANGSAVVIYAAHGEEPGDRIACGVLLSIEEAPVAVPTPTASPAGAPSPTPLPSPTASPAFNCDPSYPTVCILPPPPDLDCDDIPFTNFRVLPPDPHGFDDDNDGIGCEQQ
ncbi:MAG: hypothetical protein M3220_18630 [Chloroflexota bacterium]|nr:hypothetical protein [Chloroflexota bacterium]